MTTYTAQSSTEKLSKLKNWNFEDNSIVKKFTFKNFPEAMAMMVRIAFMCEKKNHHPEWTNVYNRLTIKFSTHDAGGVTEKDFEMAASIDSILD